MHGRFIKTCGKIESVLLNRNSSRPFNRRACKVDIIEQGVYQHQTASSVEATQKIQGVGKCGLGSAKGGERGLGRAEIRQTDSQPDRQTDRQWTERGRLTTMTR